MPENTTTEPTKIEFIQYHKPLLEDGDYQITLTQQITGEKIPANTSFQITRKFSVGAERFDLKPTAIHAVFPLMVA